MKGTRIFLSLRSDRALHKSKLSMVSLTYGFRHVIILNNIYVQVYFDITQKFVLDRIRPLVFPLNVLL